MNKFIIILILATLTFSCKVKKEKYLYQFDKVEHFKLNIDESELISTLDNPKKLNILQKNQASIVFNDSPKTMKDTLILESIEKRRI